jgi:glycosyltransferase involved in cell wall biosynthesis
LILKLSSAQTKKNTHFFGYDTEISMINYARKINSKKKNVKFIKADINNISFKKADLICAIDLDTIMPAYFAGKLKNKKLVYDAHEYFSQQKEIITRPKVYKVWRFIENIFVPKFKNGYTVSYSISKAFDDLYKIKYEVIANATSIKFLSENYSKKDKIIVYQGAVNEARGLEYLIPAIQALECYLPNRLRVYTLTQKTI